jgi:pyrimidine deaminase RibD-like protein
MTHGKDGILTEELQEQISKLHAEVQAFRNYYLQVTSVTTFLPDMKPSPRKSMG